MRNSRPWIVTAPLVLLLGWASGWLSGSGYGNPWFDALAKPWFMPPGWAFPVAWTILYLLMGVAVGLVLAQPDTPRRSAALGWFAVQLLLNLLWSPVFFAAHRVSLALAVILLLDVGVIATIVTFRRVRPLAAWLLLPYPVWLALATALTGAILRLNP